MSLLIFHTFTAPTGPTSWTQPTVTYAGHAQINGAGTTNVISNSFTFGAGKRLIAVWNNSAGSTDTSSVTVGGVAATRVDTPTNSSDVWEFWLAPVDAAGTQSVVATFSGNVGTVNLHAMALTNVGSVVDSIRTTQTTADPKVQSRALEVPLGGMGITATYAGASVGIDWLKAEQEIGELVNSGWTATWGVAKHPTKEIPQYNSGATNTDNMLSIAFAPDYPAPAMFDPSHFVGYGWQGGWHRQRYTTPSNGAKTILGMQGGAGQAARIARQPDVDKWQIEFTINALGNFGAGQSIDLWVDDGGMNVDANGGNVNAKNNWGANHVVVQAYGGGGAGDWWKNSTNISNTASWPVYAVGDKLGIRGNKLTNDIEFYHVNSSGTVTSLVTINYSGSVHYAGASTNNGASQLTMNAVGPFARTLDNGFAAYETVGGGSPPTRRGYSFAFVL